MVPRILLDTAPVPDGDGMLKLYRRGGDWQIMLGGNELMSSRLSGSEEALATLAIEAMPPGARPRLLVGGLGMGFTLRAALRHLGSQARVEVVELVPAVIEWAREPMAELFAGSLDDPRVATTAGDVAAPIAAGRGGYDAILLDVDNGPDGLTRAGNDRLYGPAGLAATRAALRPGGVLAVWSATPDARFRKRLGSAGFAVREEEVRANGGRGGARHVIWIAVRGG
ncbi:MAG: hypothetical protein ABW173_08200 [Sphingomonas sp.]